mgnify:CR=1 FL=1
MVWKEASEMANEKKPYYTDDELIARMWAKETVKDLMARHAHYYSSDLRRQECAICRYTQSVHALVLRHRSGLSSQ